MSSEYDDPRSSQFGQPGASAPTGAASKTTAQPSTQLNSADVEAADAPPAKEAAGVALPPSTKRYQFLSFIAKGGMGEVWRARDLELHRNVAVKILKEGFQNGLPAFVQEARLVASLEHPAIVAVHDVGTLDDGRPFFVMKLITGGTDSRGDEAPPPTLQQLLGKEFPVPVKDRPRFIQYCQQVCEAVGYAHARTPPLLHRDIKPSNIMVGAFGEILVMDWGIAKQLGDRTEDETPFASPTPADHPNEASDGFNEVMETKTGNPAPGSGRLPPSAGVSNHLVSGSNDVTPETGRLPTMFRLGDSQDFDPMPVFRSSSDDTATGAAKGTIAYMPPEQAKGEKHRLSPATDVFALGGLLVAALTGKPIYHDVRFERIFQKACAGDLKETFDRLSYCGADPELVAVIRKALAPNPADRYANAGELARAIGEYRDQVEQRLVDAEKKRRKQRFQLIAISVSGILVLATLLAGIVIRDRFQEEFARVDAAEKFAKDAEKNRILQENYAKLRKLTELVSSRHGNWTAEGLRQLAELRDFARACTEEEKQTIRNTAVQCLLGCGFEHVDDLETDRKISHAVYSPDGKWLAVSDRFTPPINLKLKVSLHDGRTGRKIRELTVDKASPLNNIGNLKAGAFNFNLIKSPDAITGLVFDSESKQLAFCTKYGVIYWGRFDEPKAALKSVQFPAITTPEGVRFLKGNQRLFVCLEGIHEAAILDVTDGKELARFKNGSLRNAIYDPESESLIFASGNWVKWLSAKNEKPLHELELKGADRLALIGSDSSMAVSHLRHISIIDGREKIISREIREAYADKAHSRSGMLELAVDPADRFLVSAVRDEAEGRLWDLVSGQLLAPFNPNRGMNRITIHPDGDQFMIASEEGAIRYRLGRERAHQTMPAGAREVFAFHLSDDGKRVTTVQGSATQKMRLYEYDRKTKTEKILNPALEANWNPDRDVGRVSVAKHAQTVTLGATDGFRWYSPKTPSKIERHESLKNNFSAIGPKGEQWMGGGDIILFRTPKQPIKKHQIFTEFFSGRRTISALGVDASHAVFGMNSGHLWIFPVDRMSTPRALTLKNLAEITALRSITPGTWLAALQGGNAVRFQIDINGVETGTRTNWKPHDGADIVGFAVVSPEQIVTAGKDQTLALWQMPSDDSSPELLCRWKTTNPVRQIEYDNAGDRLYWLNEREYGLHDLHLGGVRKVFEDLGAGIPK